MRRFAALGMLAVAATAAGAAAVQSALGRESPRAHAAVTPFSGWTIYTVGGTGLQRTDRRDGRPATATRIRPEAVTALADGTIAWTAVGDDPWVRTIAPDGRVATLAGTGRRGFGGDRGPARLAELSAPGDLAGLPGGGVLIVDGERVRAVDAAGIIRTVAGTGAQGFSGDGGPAVEARFAGLGEVAPLADGGFVVTDIGNERVRKVDANGTITTIAGSGATGSKGDGGPARLAELNLEAASGLAVTRDGAVLVGEWGNHAIRRIGPDGIITKVAGTGRRGGGDGPRPAAQASLNGPVDLVALPDGGILVSDGGDLPHIGGDGVLREQRMRGCTHIVPDEAALPTEGTNIFNGDGRRAGCTSNGGNLARMPDGSIVWTDLGRLRGLRAGELRVPDDIALAAFDDELFYELLDPPLTGVAQPIEELARTAAELLYERIAEPLRPTRAVVLPRSCACAGRAAAMAPRTDTNEEQEEERYGRHPVQRGVQALSRRL